MRYTTAIVRTPPASFEHGQTTRSLGRPDYIRALQQHEAYCQALRNAGVKVTVIEPDNKYPDSCFVEDTSIVTDKGAIITHPGHPTRRGEEKRAAEELAKHFSVLEDIVPPGHIDGGDVVRAEKHFFIGLSKRTNTDGAQQLSNILSKWGYTSSTIPVKSVLHLTTGSNYIGNNTMVCIDEFADAYRKHGLDVIVVESGEEYAANMLYVNDTLIMPAGYPHTKKEVVARGYSVVELHMDEFEKQDGSLSCLSKLF